MKDRLIKITTPKLRQRVLSAVKTVAVEIIPIESSRGRVLAESVHAPRPLPEMNRSAMDGYAVRHRDLAKASLGSPVALVSVADVAAGRAHRRTIKPGTTVRVMTGAPVPPGADCVVPVEFVKVEGSRVWFDEPAVRLRHLRRAGSEIRKNQLVLKRGEVIGPAQMAMLAMMDQARVKVYRKPKVAILSTGEELGPVGRKRPYGHIPDSNRYALLGLIESAGCEPIDGGRVSDDPRVLRAQLKKLARRAQFIITTGGVSAGDYDVVKILFRELGGVRIYRLPMKPGKPQAFGRMMGIPFFGLPGNPVSCMVVFDFIVRPALRKMAGANDRDLPRYRAMVVRDFPPKSRQWEFQRAVAHETDGHLCVEPVDTQLSANLRSMTEADGYVMLTPEVDRAIKGTEVFFVPLPQ
jgi:molybdopterin molybdotransferase